MSEYLIVTPFRKPPLTTNEWGRAHYHTRAKAKLEVAQAAFVAALSTEHTETIPVWVDDDPPAFGPFAELVDGRVVQLPRRHSEWFDHTRHTTPWHSDDCPDCQTEPGVHDRRQAEMQAAAQERSR